ncbi:MAG: hypothetical protein U1F50_05970 [Rubrivivax sp.]
MTLDRLLTAATAALALVAALSLPLLAPAPDAEMAASATPGAPCRGDPDPTRTP